MKSANPVIVTAKTPSGRPAVKRSLIIKELRDQIVRGLLAPGMQLPVRSNLTETFEAGPVTVQDAIAALVREGFLESRGPRGTFVARNLPHLSRYALIFPVSPADPPQWRRFYNAMSSAALRIERDGGQARELPIYHDISGHVDSHDYQKLVRQIAAHRLAGLIFVVCPPSNMRDLFAQYPDLPRVAFMPEPLGEPYNVAAAYFDYGSFFERALDYLAAQGRRNVAFIIPPHLHQDLGDRIEAALAAKGITTRPHWMQTLGLSDPVAARNVVRLLTHSSQKERPDSLIVADDNFLPHVQAGLIAGDIQTPRQITVVAHGNLPADSADLIPVTRLGFDVNHILLACMDMIDEWRAGRRPATCRMAPAVFEEEVALAALQRDRNRPRPLSNEILETGD